MNIDELKLTIINNLKYKSEEVIRLFHGRGNFYKAYEFLTVDSINEVLLVCLYEKIPDGLQDELTLLFEDIFKTYDFKSVILQKKYEKYADKFEVLFGENIQEYEAIENGLKYHINFKNRNIGLFLDMKNGREFISKISKNCNVLNLFSYTCSFSVVSLANKAKSVVNVDMAKNALNVGRKNHHINGLDTKNVKFLPYNILKSWGRIKKYGPYDIVIIDPPSFQKGSFAATKDYEKIIKRLKDLCNKDSLVLACLNDPMLDESFIKGIFKNNAKDFTYVKKLSNIDSFPSFDEQKALKNLVFRYNPF
ncbi:MAG: class I SAM-dependent methyltransferase [Campylobacterota bacterium]